MLKLIKEHSEKIKKLIVILAKLGNMIMTLRHKEIFTHLRATKAKDKLGERMQGLHKIERSNVT